MKKFNDYLINFGKLPIVLAIALIVIGDNNATADEVPAFFLKIAKNIPRIGRSEHTENFFLKKVNSEDPRSDDVNDMSSMSKRKVGFSPESETWGWQNFPLAIEGPPELWKTLAGYSHDPLYRVSDDFNNELWSRDKRTSDQQE